MTNDEIDKEIAEFCGWKLEPLDGREFNGIPVMVWVRPDGERGFPIPRYSVDLNAMHEAEKRIVDWVFWRIQLSHVVGIGYAPDLDICEDIKLFASSTAPQRAEAFLRTIGKWRDE